MEINLETGHTVLIDDCDYEKVMRWKWYAKAEGSRHYAVTVRSPMQRMHRMILNAKPEQVVDHINGNGLDNRRENLRICSREENAKNRRVSRNNKVVLEL